MAKRFSLKTEEWIHDPRTKRQFNEALFTEVADKYTFVTRVLSFGRDQSWKRQLVSRLPGGERLRCLDLACGTGDITFALAKKYCTGTIVGLDLCEPMLQIARHRNEHDHVSFMAADMCQTELESASFDVVTGGYALRNSPHLPDTLKEVHRLLRPGGTAAFLDFSKPTRPWLQAVEYRLLVMWGGLWGLILHGNAEVYAYIPKSLRSFPDQRQLSVLLKEAGFAEIEGKKFLGGVTALNVFRKPD